MLRQFRGTPKHGDMNGISEFRIVSPYFSMSALWLVSPYLVPEGRVDRHGFQTAEGAAAFLGDGQAVLDADAKFSVDVDSRLVTESHSRLELQRVPADKVRIFVSLQADAVAEAVGEVLVVRTEAGILDNPAGRPVDGFAGRPRFDCLEGRGLGFPDDFPDLTLLVGRLAEEDSPRDVGAIAFDRTAAVNENRAAFLEIAANHRAGGKTRVRAELGPAPACQSHLLVRGAYSRRQGPGTHPFAELLEALAVGQLGDLVGQVHVADLFGRLDAPAAFGTDRSVDKLKPRRSPAQSV